MFDLFSAKQQRNAKVFGYFVAVFMIFSMIVAYIPWKYFVRTCLKSDKKTFPGERFFVIFSSNQD